MTWTTSGPIFNADLQPEVSCVVLFWELTPLLAKDTRKRVLPDHKAITHEINTWRYALNQHQKTYELGRRAEMW